MVHDRWCILEQVEPCERVCLEGCGCVEESAWFMIDGVYWSRQNPVRGYVLKVVVVWRSLWYNDT